VLATAFAGGLRVRLAVALFAAGALVLVARVGLRWEREEAAPLIAIALVAPVLAWLHARRKVPSHTTAAAWLDVHGGADGRIVTEDEIGRTTWSDGVQQRLERSLRDLPRVRAMPAMAPSFPALAFVALALWIDPPREQVGPPRAVSSAAIDRVEEKLETLEETVELAPETAQELQAQMERIEAEAADGRPESTFEALDRMEERLEDLAQDALEAAQQANRDLASAATDPSLGEAQTSLESALAKMDEAGLADELPKPTQDALAPGTLTLPKGVQLSSAQLAKLSKELKGVLDERLAKLAGGNLIDPKSLKELGELGELADLGDLELHECDEECKKPGGT
jgi:hypothetical protein